MLNELLDERGWCVLNANIKIDKEGEFALMGKQGGVMGYRFTDNER